MKVTLPESAIKTLKDILKDNQERPQNIRVYFARNGLFRSIIWNSIR